MNEQDATQILSAKLDEAERDITALIRNNSDKEAEFLLGRYSQMAKSRWHGKKLLGLLASYAIMRGMRLAGRM
jgi:hypothetical protein